MNKEIQEEDQELEEPQEPVDPPQEKNPHKRKLAWVREVIHLRIFCCPVYIHIPKEKRTKLDSLGKKDIFGIN